MTLLGKELSVDLGRDLMFCVDAVDVGPGLGSRFLLFSLKYSLSQLASCCIHSWSGNQLILFNPISCNYCTARHSALIPVFIWKKFPKYTWERNHNMARTESISLNFMPLFPNGDISYLCLSLSMDAVIMTWVTICWERTLLPYFRMKVLTKMSQIRKHCTTFRYIGPRTALCFVSLTYQRMPIDFP